MKSSCIFPLGSLAVTINAFSTNLPVWSQDDRQWIAVSPRFVVDWDEPRLVRFGQDQPPVWISELEKFSAKAQGVAFMDLTENGVPLGAISIVSSKTLTFEYPVPNNEELVKPVLETLTTRTMKDFLEVFTAFETRDYRSPSGKESQKWLLKAVKNLTEEIVSSSLADKVSVYEFIHPFGQNTVVARIAGSSRAAETLVLSAHQDSTNRQSPYLPAPGADDDGSGSAVILEALRAVLTSGVHPERNIEWHWYAAEEAGLLGSLALTQDYVRRSVNIIGNLHFDTIAAVAPEDESPVIGLVTDTTDPKATNFAALLIDTYCSIGWKADWCGWGCSDHTSWTEAGYSSASTTGSPFQYMKRRFRNVHTIKDRYDDETFSFEHLLEFAKLATAYAIELGGRSDASRERP